MQSRLTCFCSSEYNLSANKPLTLQCQHVICSSCAQIQYDQSNKITCQSQNCNQVTEANVNTLQLSSCLVQEILSKQFYQAQLVQKASTEFFPGIGKIQYEGPSSKNPLAFKYYNPDEVILGKKMRDHLRFSVVFWHTFRNTGRDPFGEDTIKRPWDDGSQTMENALRRIDAAFEFFSKLSIDYYAWHDVDASPEGENLEQTEKNLNVITDYMLRKQKETGVKCLWATQNLFSHVRFMNGGATNPDLLSFAWACAKTKLALEAGQKLGAEGHVFWGGREGYQSTLNTNIKKELDHLAAFLRMAVEYKNKIGAKFQFLIEPKPREPTKHQYDYDAQTVMCFLKQYGLDEHFKLNIEPNHTTLAGHDYEHDIIVSSIYQKLGSIDCNSGDPMLGWDTDQFPMDLKKCTIVMLQVLKQGGLAPGGLNFDSKVRRESTDLEDFFLGHIGGMDTFAHALRIAAKIIEDGIYEQMLLKRYETWESELGKKIEKGQATLEELYTLANEKGEPQKISAKQELFENVFQSYL